MEAFTQLSVGRTQSMNAAEKRRLGAFLQAHESFRAIRHTLPMQYLIAFLLVALDEGKGVSEYARQAGVRQSVMSRHLLDLAHRNKLGGPGYGLVALPQDPQDRRRHPCSLTDKGRAIAGAIVRALERA
jgi:DNA-binding MarR family transcriptional regulator